MPTFLPLTIMRSQSSGVAFCLPYFHSSCRCFFQAIGYGRASLTLSLLRQIVCLLPLF